MVSDETASIRQLIDKDRIVDLVHEYSYCVDHRRYDDVVALFTEDCVVDYAPGIAPVRSREGLRAMFDQPGGGFAATSHHNANVLVTFDSADRASCARLSTPGTSARTEPLLGYGATTTTPSCVTRKDGALRTDSSRFWVLRIGRWKCTRP